MFFCIPHHCDRSGPPDKSWHWRAGHPGIISECGFRIAFSAFLPGRQKPKKIPQILPAPPALCSALLLHWGRWGPSYWGPSCLTQNTYDQLKELLKHFIVYQLFVKLLPRSIFFTSLRIPSLSFRSIQKLPTRSKKLSHRLFSFRSKIK